MTLYRDQTETILRGDRNMLYNHAEGIKIASKKQVITLIFAAVLLAVAQSFSSPVYAIGSFNPSAAELALLPPYCGPRAEKWGNDSNRPEVAHWMGIFGREHYINMHHYCITLLSIHQAQLSTRDQDRRAAYVRAMNNLEYMEQRAAPDFALWPDMLHNRARIEKAQGNTGAAINSLQKAIAHKADYVPPYAELADLHLQLGQKNEARKVLEAGLAQQPNSRLLLRRLNCLDDPNSSGCR